MLTQSKRVYQARDEGSSAILQAVALDATDDLLGTLVGIEKAKDDLLPLELNMFSILRREFRSFARSFLDSKEARDLIARMADPANPTSLPSLKRKYCSSTMKCGECKAFVTQVNPPKIAFEVAIVYDFSDAE